MLKKGAKKVGGDDDDEEEKKKRDEPKWNSKELAVGNWFSGTSYYQAVEDKGAKILTGDNLVSMLLTT